MNYLPYVSWGAYGATSGTERASFFSSWGLLGIVGAVVKAYKDGLYYVKELGGGVIYLRQL